MDRTKAALERYEQLIATPFVGPLPEGMTHRFDEDGVCVHCEQSVEQLLAKDEPRVCKPQASAS